MTRWLLAAAISIMAGACADSESRPPTTRAYAGATTYARTPTLACVRRAGGTVTEVRRSDDRRAALADLAQRAAVEIQLRDQIVLVSFERDAAHADLLVQALRVPDDPYVLARRANVVLMHRHFDRAAAVVIECLRRG